MTAPLLELDGVSRSFVRRLDMAERVANLFGAGLREQTVRAVDGVDLAVAEGEVLGLVGESGCGKSTLGRVAAGVLDATAGTVRFNGRDTRSGNRHERRQAALAVQMVFQDATSSLNPRMRVGDIVAEAARVHGLIPAGGEAGFLAETLSRVGLDPEVAERYPHQFSGGQRARIGIARALAVRPRVLICDEATAALDVSIQAQVVNLFMRLRAELGLTYLFVSHDLSLVEHIADRIAVMYLGRIVELASTEELFANPRHPYTRALLQDVPKPEPHKVVFAGIKGEMPSPLRPPPGCHFHPRCPIATEICRTVTPELRDRSASHRVACHLAE